LDVIFNHPNVAPFISLHLIKHLVTSNPSSEYVARVATVFNDNGQGVKGDLKAVIEAILTDKEVLYGSQEEGFGKLKEPFLVFTQLLRTFDVKPADGWKSTKDDTVTVNGVYAYRTPESSFGQAPLRSKSVFNFYMTDYIPSHNDFAEGSYTAPESQIMTDGNILNAHNRIHSFLRDFEVNKITKINNKTLTEFTSDKTHYTPHVMFINFDRELALFEQALEGDTNGDFENIGDFTSRKKAVNALLIHLDKVMLGNTMTDEFKEILGDYLKSAERFSRTSNKYQTAHRLITEAVRFIASSPAYMVQK